MTEGKRNIPYSAEDIRNYLDGRLSDPEMQAMEKAALEDPFLSDAIEGYEESRRHSESFEVGLADLQSRLSQRLRRKERKTGTMAFISNWKIAAAVLFLLGLTVFTYTFFVNKKPKELSVTVTKENKKEVPVPPGSRSADTSVTTLERSAATPGGSDSVGTSISVSADKERTKLNKKTKTVAEEENRLRKKDIIDADVATSDALTDTLVKKSRAVAPFQNDVVQAPFAKTEDLKITEQTSGLAISRDKAVAENFIQGVVVDEKGKPIPYAPVKIKGARRETYTDTSGFFKLYMKNPSQAALVFVHPSGYEPVSTELRTDSNLMNRIQMLPSANSPGEIANSGNYPTIIGWDALIRYVNANKKITTADSLLKGEEIISFFIHPDGKLSSFKIEKSISRAHDTEFLRLIKTGPPLKIQGPGKQRGRIRIFFP
jgi:CarboxypepD_reg-like domain